MAYAFKYGDQPLDGVTVQRAVGRGGFGEVYYALTDSGKQLAVKYLRANPEVELRGISHVMNLKSPHLITIYDVKYNPDREPFVLMEYVSGPSLRDLLNANPDGLGEQKAAFFLEGIVKGLSYLHDRGIVHRDLKPGNIFYDDGYVKIGDYGLSKHISMSAHSGNTASVGTVHYMAPEIGSGSYTKAIDTYALGVILYEMLCGQLPFTGSSMGEILMRHLSDNPDLSGIPAPFDKVIAKALAKDPKERYQDVNEMLDSITSVAAISQSIASFDATVLAAAPRADVHAEQQTMTTPPRRPVAPNLDVHSPAGFPDIPPLPQLLGDDPALHKPKLSRKAEKRAQKAAKKAEKQQELITRQAHGPWWPQLLAALFLAVTVSIAVAILFVRHRGPEAGMGLTLMLCGATTGTLIAHLAILSRLISRTGVVDRMIYVGAGALGALPGIAILMEEVREEFGAIIVPILLFSAIFDIDGRIKRGRRGKIDGGGWFWPAVLGFVVAHLTRLEYPMPWIFAIITGVYALMLQTAAAVWSLPDYAMPGAALGAHVTPQNMAAPHAGATGPAAATPMSAAQPANPHDTPPPVPQQHAEERLDQPSFVGRATNFGLTLLGKSLVLIGIVFALAVSTDKPWLKVSDGGAEVVAWGNTISHTETYYDHSAKGGVSTRQELHQIPRGVAFAPIALGFVVLLIARRSTGAAHIVRGIFGVAAVICATTFALGPASNAIRIIANGDFDYLDVRDVILLGVMAVSLLFAVTLLFWPRRKRHAAPRPVVI